MPLALFSFPSYAFYPEPVTTAFHQRTESPTWQRYSVAAGTVGAALFARFAAPFFAVFREVFTGTFLAAGVCWALAASALPLAQRFFVAATIAALPAALSLRFGFATSGATGDGGPGDFFDAAHLFRCASAMAFLPAALIFRRLRFGASGVAAVSVGPPSSMARSSAIWASIRRFCCSKPSTRAVIISGVSLWVGIRIKCSW